MNHCFNFLQISFIYFISVFNRLYKLKKLFLNKKIIYISILLLYFNIKLKNFLYILLKY
jgi:hypothetical protein